MVMIDPDIPLMEDWIWGIPALPATKVDVGVPELSGVRRPHNNPLAGVTDDRIVAGLGVGMQTYHQLEVTLLGVWSAFLSHVVARGFGEVEAADGHFSYLAVA